MRGGQQALVTIVLVTHQEFCANRLKHPHLRTLLRHENAGSARWSIPLDRRHFFF